MEQANGTPARAPDYTQVPDDALRRLARIYQGTPVGEEVAHELTLRFVMSLADAMAPGAVR